MPDGTTVSSWREIRCSSYFHNVDETWEIDIKCQALPKERIFLKIWSKELSLNQDDFSNTKRIVIDISGSSALLIHVENRLTTDVAAKS